MTMRFIGLMAIFLAWNLEEATGQATVARSCRLFTSPRRGPMNLDGVKDARMKEILKNFLTCAEADSQIDLEAYYFSYKNLWSGLRDDLTALMAASLYGADDVARALLHYYADFNTKNRQGWSALDYAAIGANFDILNIMIDLGGDVNSKTGNYGSTPLMSAALYGHNTTVSKLIAKGADVNIIGTPVGYTALMYAANNGNLGIIAELLDHGAYKSTRTLYGRTAEDVARMNGRHNVANFIRNYRG